MNQCKCGSYAINDDPKNELCDICMRNATIATLKAQRDELLEAARDVELQFHAQEISDIGLSKSNGEIGKATRYKACSLYLNITKVRAAIASAERSKG